MSRYHEIAAHVADIVTEKNAAYGNSFEVAPRILAELWPGGVPVSDYGAMLTVVRVLDKLKRIATNKDKSGENPWMDIAGYALLELAK